MKRSDFIKQGALSLFGFKLLGNTKEEKEEEQPEGSVKCIIKQNGKEYALGFMILDDPEYNDKIAYYLGHATAVRIRQIKEEK